MKKFFYIFGAFLFFIPLHETVHAQWSVGVSYEYRDEDPNNGFGFRAEKSIFDGIPLLDLSLRGHFSNFNETMPDNRRDINSILDFGVYDFGFAALAGFSLGLVSPYVGAGIGHERFKLDTDDPDESINDRNIYWNGFIGANVEILPYLKPFIEFRAGKLTSAAEIEADEIKTVTDNINRLAIGVSIRF